MKSKIIKLSAIKQNPNNPRSINKDKFAKLVKSIEEFPRMLELRPIVLNKDNIVLGGNMRLKACKQIGLTEVPVVYADDLTEQEQQQFIIKDNVGFGDWDWELLANEWDIGDLADWGLDIPIDQHIDKMEDDDEIELPQSVQLEPPKEYILIMAEPNSVDWEELKEMLQLKMVRRGGYKKGSTFDAVALERVIWWNDFKNRINVNSSTK
jgi:hypothetical protein